MCLTLGAKFGDGFYFFKFKWKPYMYFKKCLITLIILTLVDS